MFKKECAHPILLEQRGQCIEIVYRISAGAKSKVKSSVQRGIKSQIVETYPLLAPVIDDIIPKKSQLDLLKL